MLIQYCDGCAAKIPEDQFKNGQAYKDASGYYCGNCVAKGVVKRRGLAAKPLQRAMPRGERPSTAKNPLLSAGAFLAGTGVVLIILAVLFLANWNKQETKPAAAPQPDPKSAISPREALPPSASTGKPPDSPAREGDAEWVSYAAKLLETAKNTYKEHPEDVQGYQLKLKVLSSAYKGTPSGKEASVLLAELKPFFDAVVGNQAVLIREGASATERLHALEAIAKAKGKSELSELLWAITNTRGEVLSDLAQILPQLDRAALAKSRNEILELAAKHDESAVRGAAYAALMRADGSPEPTWTLTLKAPHDFIDLLGGTAMLSKSGDASLLSELRAKMQALIKELPETHEATTVPAQYVRIELPGPGRTLSLAEVQVFSGGKNVALGGTASQSSGIPGGEAAHAIDGRTDGVFGAYSSSHTAESETNPWWMVDLHAEFNLDKIVIWNRTDGAGSRLDGFTVIALDAKHVQTLKREHNPAPLVNCTIDVVSAPTQIRLATIGALARMTANR